MNPIAYFLIAAFLLVAPWPIGDEVHLLQKIEWIQTGHEMKIIDWWDLFQHSGIPIIMSGFGIRQLMKIKKEKETPKKED